MISVIIPAYQAEKTISKCIGSILENHSVKEVIIVNDGSSDCTEEICKKLSEKDDRIKLLSKKNEGPALARKAGIDLAKGDWITFVDADDYLDHAAYDRIVSYLDEEPDALEFGIREVNTDGTIISEVVFDEHVYEGQECLTHYVKNKNSGYALYNKIFRTELFQETETLNVRISEDIILASQLLHHAKKTKTITEVLYNYVLSENSLVRSCFQPYKMDYVKSHEFLENYYLQVAPELCRYEHRKNCIETMLIAKECAESEFAHTEMAAILYQSFRESFENCRISFLLQKEKKKRVARAILYYLMPELSNRVYTVYYKFRYRS